MLDLKVEGEFLRVYEGFQPEGPALGSFVWAVVEPCGPSGARGGEIGTLSSRVPIFSASRAVSCLLQWFSLGSMSDGELPFQEGR